jgi:hypothetical protein
MENALEKYRQLSAPVEGPANALATPYGYRAAQDFMSALGIAQHILGTPSRVGEFVDRSVQAGGFQNMDPNEVGSMAAEAGFFPVLGALGGVPRNAAGMVASGGSEFHPLKYGAGGAAAAGAGTVGVDAYNGEFPGFTVDYMTDRLGPNMGYGALAGAGLAVGGALIDDIGEGVAQREKMRDLMQHQEKMKAWRSQNVPSTTGQRGPTGPQGPTGFGSQVPPSGGQGPSAVQPRQGPASGMPNAPQNTGNPSSLGSSGGLLNPSNDYLDMHTVVARQVLNRRLNDGAATVTPDTLVADLASEFNRVGLPVPPSLRDRARETLSQMSQQNPNLRKSMDDPMQVLWGVINSTGKPGTLGLAGLGVGAAAGSDDDPALLEYLRMTGAL